MSEVRFPPWDGFYSCPVVIARWICMREVCLGRAFIGCLILSVQDVLIWSVWNLGRLGLGYSLLKMSGVLLSGDDTLNLYIYVRTWQFLLSALRTSTRN